MHVKAHIALLNFNHEEGLESLSVLNLDQEFGFWLKRLD
jgi:hypothetical protein